MLNAKNAFYAVGALLFFVFMTLQFNDATQYGNHDAWTWIIIYFAMSALNVGLIFKKVKLEWLYSWAGFAWGCLLFRLQDDHGNMYFSRLNPSNYWDPSGTSMIQNSNESGGLLILAVWATVLVFVVKKFK